MTWGISKSLASNGAVLIAAMLLGERLGTLALTGSAIVLAATLLIVKYDTSY